MQSGHVDIIRTLCLKIWNEEGWNGGGGCKGEECGYLIIFSIFIGLKNQFIEDWENWFWKKKKNDLKKLQGEGCVSDQYLLISIPMCPLCILNV